MLRRLTTVTDLLIMGFGCFYLLSWFMGRPWFYVSDGPVLSPFTMISLMILCASRLARRYLELWPAPLSMAWIVLVIGGNVSSICMQLVVPRLLFDAFPNVVPTSPLTSLGLILFCFYELLFIIRETPKQTFIVDDILLHLALLPGVLSVIGHCLSTPAYVSASHDPRIGISLTEMMLMAAYAGVAALSNPHLFLWRFLRGSRVNVVIFLGLFANQFIAPIVVALLANHDAVGRAPGVEIFVLLAGVVATLSFLLFQARRPSLDS